MAQSFPIECIEWDDSNGVFHWRTLADLKDITPKHIVSIGYVIHETEAAVYLAQSDDRDPDESDRHFDNTMIITKTGIVSRKKISLWAWEGVPDADGRTVRLDA